MRENTELVRGGLTRSGFDETAEALFLTSGYVYELSLIHISEPTRRRL